MPHDPADRHEDLGIALLALLTEAPATPAVVREQLVTRRHDRVVAWDDAALAAALDHLAADGLIAVTDPATGALSPTTSGREALVAWTADTLAEHVPSRPAFDLALLTAHAVPPAVAREAFARRLAELDDATGQLTTRIRTSSRRGLSEAYWMQADHRRALLVAEFTWLSRLVERMDAGELTWEAGDAPEAPPESV